MGIIASQRDITFTAGTDYTIIGQANTGAEVHSIASEYRSDAEDTNPDITWTTVSNWAAIAAELKAESTVVVPPKENSYRRRRAA